MSKNVIYNVFYVAEYVAFILATIAVIVYQFTASEFLAISALVLYVVSFGIMTTNECIGVENLKKRYKKLNACDVSLDNKIDELKSKGISVGENEKPNIIIEDKNSKDTVEKIEANEGLNKKDELLEIKKQMNWGYAKIVLCGLFCCFAFVVLVLF